MFLSRFHTRENNLDEVLAFGLRRGVAVSPGSIPETTGIRRFKVIDVWVRVELTGERFRWVLWQGDNSIATTEYESVSEVNTEDRSAFPIRGGIVGDEGPLDFHYKPNGLFINRDQAIVLAGDPTIGGGRIVMSLCCKFLELD